MLFYFEFDKYISTHLHHFLSQNKYEEKNHQKCEAYVDLGSAIKIHHVILRRIKTEHNQATTTATKEKERWKEGITGIAFLK